MNCKGENTFINGLLISSLSLSLSLSLLVLPFLVSFSLLPELCYVSDLPVYVTKEIYKETHREEEGDKEREREHNHTADTWNKPSQKPVRKTRITHSPLM